MRQEGYRPHMAHHVNQPVRSSNSCAMVKGTGYSQQKNMPVGMLLIFTLLGRFKPVTEYENGKPGRIGNHRLQF